ncbi:MAG TPA: IS110 family transposase, partial [Candidatus Atribacteria bacterium]|nr:IS110 family transposase [Candidatus Atribacteria bacterium]HAJ33663.1 IS110 family transposase [Candidatus Atribacteria bacterium]
MYSIGIDAHKRYSQITIMQENGKIVNRYKVNNDRKSIKRALSRYSQEGAKAVLESGCNWGLIYDMGSDGNLEGKGAHPLKEKGLAEDKIKTDQNSGDILTT